MSYEIEFKPRAIKDIENLQHRERERAAVERLSDNLAGDVKRLTSFTPEYRLRVSDYRVLFEVEGNKVADLSCSPSERCLQMSLRNETAP